MAQRSSRSIVLELVEGGLGRRDAAVVERLIAEDFVQHDPFLPTGRHGVHVMLDELRLMPEHRFRPRRILEDGDFVLLHSEWLPTGQELAAFDLFRAHDGRLVEHWDGIEPQPRATRSGRSMLDGTSAVRDHVRGAANKALVRDFVETVLIARQLERIGHFFDGDRCMQHDPHVDDGVVALTAALRGAVERHLEHQRLHRLMGEGNFVLTLCAGRSDGREAALYDLYRVEHGHIAEHWDVVQPVPREQAHQNGMF